MVLIRSNWAEAKRALDIQLGHEGSPSETHAGVHSVGDRGVAKREVSNVNPVIDAGTWWERQVHDQAPLPCAPFRHCPEGIDNEVGEGWVHEGASCVARGTFLGHVRGDHLWARGRRGEVVGVARVVGASVAGTKTKGQTTQEVVYPLALRVS